MSTCISMHGEYSDHELSEGTAEERFVCSRCFVLMEDDLLDALDLAEKRIRAVEAERDAALSANPLNQVANREELDFDLLERFEY